MVVGATDRKEKNKEGRGRERREKRAYLPPSYSVALQFKLAAIFLKLDLEDC